MKNVFGIEGLNGQLDVQQETNTVIYVIEDFEEPITKEMLRTMKKQLGGGKMTLVTNAGVEIHSTELKNKVWNNIEILRYKR